MNVFDIKVKVRKTAEGRLFATSEQIPMYVMADSPQQLEERVVTTLDAFFAYLKTQHTPEEIEAWLQSKGLPKLDFDEFSADALTFEPKNGMIP